MATQSAEHRDMSPGIRVTNHAILRYLERVENCTRREAIDRLCHALQISERASKKHMRCIKGFGGRKYQINGAGTSMRFCAVESLLLVVRPVPGAVLIVTVIKIELPN